MDSTTLTEEIDNLFDFSELFVDDKPSLINMAEEKTLRELDAPLVQQAPLCINAANPQAPLELKSGLIHLLPKFRGVNNVRRELFGMKQHTHETLFDYWERFKELCASCPQHGIPEQALISVFCEEECSKISVIDTSSSSNFINHSLNPLETALVLNSGDLDEMALEQVRWLDANQNKPIHSKNFESLELGGLSCRIWPHQRQLLVPQNVKAQFDDTRFVSAVAENRYTCLFSQATTAIHERGFELDPDSDLDKSMVATVDVFQWADFIKPPTTAGVLSIVQEFYSNFANKDDDDRVFVRGKRVPISREIIRVFYKLPDVHADIDCAYVASMG
ncbi:DNA-directed DNA polymerase [Senna tora]|uniref:DNA-directed DNA polymerase n=1 Tax=Senna tora TaxID=362788 RepID=A0A834SCS8_9FABA|nr:DNA-directed DNA polymerase [Senna tora]